MLMNPMSHVYSQPSCLEVDVCTGRHNRCMTTERLHKKRLTQSSLPALSGHVGTHEWGRPHRGLHRADSRRRWLQALAGTSCTTQSSALFSRLVDADAKTQQPTSP